MKNLSIFSTFARSTATISVMLLLLIGAALGAPAPTSAALNDFFATSGQDPSPTTAQTLEVVKNFNIGSNAVITTTIAGNEPTIAPSTYVSFRSGVATTATRGAPTSFNSSRNVMTISGANSQITIGQNETGRTNFDSRFKHITNAATRGFMITSIAVDNGYGGAELASSSFL